MIDWELQLMRALLFVPGSDERKLAKVGTFGADVIGVDLTAEAAELAYGRGRLVVAARAAGMAPPLDGPYFGLADEEGLVRDCRRARGLCFQGKVRVYPPQVAPMQRTFSELTEDEAAATRRLVEAFEEAEARGVASIRVGGAFVDYPIYRLARRRLDRWESLEAAAGLRR